jgi:hypothetical protein
VLLLLAGVGVVLSSLFDALLFGLLMAGLIIGIILVREYILRPKEILFVVSGMKTRHLGNKEDIISWKEMRSLLLYKGEHGISWVRRYQALLIVDGRFWPVILTPEIGELLNEKYSIANGAELPIFRAE